MKDYVNGTLAMLKKQTPETYLLVLTGALVLLIATQFVQCGMAQVQRSAMVRSMGELNNRPLRKTDPKRLEKYEAIGKKGILGQAGPAGGPAPELRVYGVLGSKALMGPGPQALQPYEVGADLPGGEKLVTIDTDSVVVEKAGAKRTLKVFDPANAPPPSPGGPGGPGGPPGGPPPGAPGMPPGMPGGPGGPGGPPGMPGGPQGMPQGMPGVPPGVMPGGPVPGGPMPAPPGVVVRGQ